MTDTNVYQQRLSTYAALIAETPGLELKGKKMPYTSMNGNMFSFLSSDGGLCFRLSAKDCRAFMDTHNTQPVMQYGSVMRDYVAVPDAMLKDPPALKTLFETAIANARSLKAKPTKR